MSVKLYWCLQSDVNMKNKQYSFSYSNYYFLFNIMEKHPLAWSSDNTQLCPVLHIQSSSPDQTDWLYWNSRGICTNVQPYTTNTPTTKPKQKESFLHLPWFLLKNKLKKKNEKWKIPFHFHPGDMESLYRHSSEPKVHNSLCICRYSTPFINSCIHSSLWIFL